MPNMRFPRQVRFFRHTPNRRYPTENVFRIISNEREIRFDIYPVKLAEKLADFPAECADYELDSREQTNSLWRPLGFGKLDPKALNFNIVDGVPESTVPFFAAEFAMESLRPDHRLSDFLEAEVLLNGEPIEPGLTIGSLRPKQPA